MKHAQKYTKQYNNNNLWKYTVLKHAQKYTKQ